MLIKVADGSYIDPARIWAVWVDYDDHSDEGYSSFMVKVNDGVFVNAYEEFEEACAFADALAAQINGECGL